MKTPVCGLSLQTDAVKKHSPMSKTERRQYSGAEKVKILRLHLLEGKPISDVCEQHGINPSLFYQWQKHFFENGERAFEPQTGNRTETRLEKELAAVNERLKRKHEVLSELMEEHIRLKKDLGEL
jgi:transposase-like protein